MTPLSHILIADAVWRRIQWPSSLRGHILLGSLAPDAYRTSADLSFRDTHFRSRRVVGLRMQDFTTNLLRPAFTLGRDEEHGFWVGWLTHLTADVIWRRLVRLELSDVWRECRDPDENRAADARERFRLGCDAADRELMALRSQHVAETQALLRETRPDYPVTPLTHELLSHWVGTVCADHLPPPDPGPLPRHSVTTDFVSRALEVCTEEAAGAVNAELREFGAGSEHVL